MVSSSLTFAVLNALDQVCYFTLCLFAYNGRLFIPIIYEQRTLSGDGCLRRVFCRRVTAERRSTEMTSTAPATAMATVEMAKKSLD